MAQSPKILSCRCGHYHLVKDDVSARITRTLSESGLDVRVVDDLCALAAEKDPILAEYSACDNLHVIACYPRAVKWLFHRADAPLSDDRTTIHNARRDDPDSIISSLTSRSDLSESPAVPTEADVRSSWIPWFPVIDYDRCVNCRQCLDFCLFGVYAQSDDGKVEVVNPQGCKTNCPACSRLCPQTAIIFPKYEHSPINGDEVDESAVDRQKNRSELEALLGGDIHDILRKRKAKKGLFAGPDHEDAELSTQQKLSRLSGLQKQLDIPQEVLDSLTGQSVKSTINNTGSAICPNSDICPGNCQQQGGKA
jgi:Pyruvate/2-oxoacid:ferredoxin oxidoreductase delta subunit